MCLSNISSSASECLEDGRTRAESLEKLEIITFQMLRRMSDMLLTWILGDFRWAQRFSLATTLPRGDEVLLLLLPLVVCFWILVRFGSRESRALGYALAVMVEAGEQVLSGRGHV